MLNSLLILIFIRPFISSLAFPYANFIYSAILLVFLTIWFIYRRISFKNIQVLKYPLILFSLALIISVIFSIDKINSLREIYKYLTGLLLFLITASFEYKDRVRIIRTVILAGFVISILAIYQYFFGFQHILEYLAKNGSPSSFTLNYYIRNKRVFFPFVTPNALAGCLAMIIPLTLIHKNKIWLITLLSSALLLTNSLSAFISLVLALGLYFYLQDKLKKRKIILIFGLAIIGLLFIIRSVTYIQYLQPISSTTIRLSYWKDTLDIIRASPITGVGIGNFILAHSRYAHNSYLQIWAEIGILGIISILWLVILLFKSALKNITENTQKNQIISLIAANTVFLAHNLLDFTFFLPEVALLWWIILGLLVAKENNEHNYRHPNL